jgi:hypothetical protein
MFSLLLAVSARAPVEVGLMRLLASQPVAVEFAPVISSAPPLLTVIFCVPAGAAAVELKARLPALIVVPPV